MGWIPAAPRCRPLTTPAETTGSPLAWAPLGKPRASRPSPGRGGSSTRSFNTDTSGSSAFRRATPIIGSEPTRSAGTDRPDGIRNDTSLAPTRRPLSVTNSPGATANALPRMESTCSFDS